MSFSSLNKALICGFILSVLFSFSRFSGTCEGIYDKILRLHIIANSDSAEDQALKLKVRDKILESTAPHFRNAEKLGDAEKISDEMLRSIEAAAREEVVKNGYDCSVKAEVAETYFNTRKYKNVTMPAGKYKALRVTLGEGEGQNWWCVMFPPMCLPAAEEEQELETVLTFSELEIVEGEGFDYEIRFKFVEIFFDVKNWFEDLGNLFFPTDQVL